MLLPTFSVIRQSLAALVPEEHRRPAYALDSMSVEVSFMIGPALAVLLATTVSPRATMYAVGGGIVLAGLLLFVLNPPIRAAHEEAPSERRVPLRSWLTPRLVGILAISVATTLVLGGTDVAVVAVLREAGQVQFTGAGARRVGGVLAGGRLRLRRGPAGAAAGRAPAGAGPVHDPGRASPATSGGCWRSPCCRRAPSARRRSPARPTR